MRKWLIEARRLKGLTQDDIAETAGTTRQMISAVENGARPSVRLAKVWACALDLDWTRFYDDIGGGGDADDKAS